MLPGVENLKGHPYIVLFLLLVRMCEGLYVLSKEKIYIIKHGKRKQERHKFNHNSGG